MDESVKEQLQTDLLFTRNELEAERQKGAFADPSKMLQLEQKENEIVSQIDAWEKQEITQKQAEYNGGLKEVIFTVFDAVIPVEAGREAFGINDFQDKGETFRQLIDVAVDENNDALNVYIAGLLEAKDAKIRELTANLIEKDAMLQESNRKEQTASDNYERGLIENERLEQRIVSLENALAEKNVEIAEQAEQLKAKEDQIGKLTEEINKPQVTGIILPNQTKPSATLQTLLEEAKNKSIKSQAEIALSGQTFRGKVTLTPAPAVGGGETDNSTFRIEDTAVVTSSSWVPNTEDQMTYEVPPSLTEEDGDGNGLAEETSSVAGSATAIQALEARLSNVEARLAFIEQSAVNAA